MEKTQNTVSRRKLPWKRVAKFWIVMLKHCEKNITLLWIKSNAIWGFGTQDAISVQPLAIMTAEIKSRFK